MNKIPYLLMLALLAASCTQPKDNPVLTDIEHWKLGWRMVASQMDGEFALAESQFDSLLIGTDKPLGYNFLLTGFEILHQNGHKEKALAILEQQDPALLPDLCNSQLFKDLEFCESVAKVEVQQPELQLELIKMYVNDQAVRGNVMEGVILKYGLDSAEVATGDAMSIDSENRERLKGIFKEHGYPTKAMVGKEAMHGVFLMVQHADQDPEWQKAQLIHFEKAVKSGDMDGQGYAYLYDRIRTHEGGKQLYGTQFSKVDPMTGTVELFETEDLDNLDKRRMELGMMPVEMYKEFMLKNMKRSMGAGE
jgi:hypothetical protein